MNTLREFLRYISDSFKDEKAYMWLQDGEIRSKTITELLKESDFAAADIARRFGTRRKMALIGDMSYPWMCAYYGIMNSSNISVPMDTKLAPAEIAGRLDFADVSVVFLSGKFKSLENEICASSDKVEAILPLVEYVYGLNGSDSCPEIGEIEPDALASLMFTSGTSGDGYKAAMITHRSIMADVAEPVHLCNPGDRLLSILPVHHCFELFVGQMKYLLLGGTICINDNMSNLIPNLNRFGISTIVAVPAIANLLAAFIEQNCRTKTPAEVRDLLGGKLARITIGGASVSREVIDRLAMIGITVFVGYGLTETSGGCFANCDASVRPREAGKPYAQGLDVRIIEDEICLRGPSIMQGYYKNPGLTAKVMDGGWFHTGDIGELTDEGYVIIHGRKDNMIKTGNGEKVYPETWESRLTNMSRVAAAMVCAVNDHLTALILLKEDTPENREAVETEIKRINNALPNYEKILDIRFREKPFPLTTSMKIRRSLVLGELESATGTAKRKPAQNDSRPHRSAPLRC